MLAMYVKESSSQNVEVTQLSLKYSSRRENDMLLGAEEGNYEPNL